MLYRYAADLVLLAHCAFVAFVVAGGLLCFRWPRVRFVQLPAAVWGLAVEWTGGVCPLTPLENALRRLGGEAGYGGGFIQHYLVAVLYPAGLTRSTQVVLGIGVIAVNAAVYAIWWRRSGRRVAARKQ